MQIADVAAICYTDSIALTIYRLASIHVPPSFSLLLLKSITAMILSG